jgi:hypothetical protein
MCPNKTDDPLDFNNFEFPPGTKRQEAYRNEMAMFLCVVNDRKRLTKIVEKAREYGLYNIEQIQTAAWKPSKLVDLPRDEFTGSLQSEKKLISFLHHVCTEANLTAEVLLALIDELIPCDLGR